MKTKISQKKLNYKRNLKMLVYPLSAVKAAAIKTSLTLFFSRVAPPSIKINHSISMALKISSGQKRKLKR